MQPGRRVVANGSIPVVMEVVGPEGAGRLAQVGARLQRASHPGVVGVLESVATDEGGWRLVTTHGGGPLSTVEGLDVTRLAGLAASVASTLADLHELGVVHGRISEHRILLGSDGRPVICSLGQEPVGLGPEDDVAGLAAAVEAVLVGPRTRRSSASRSDAIARALQAAVDVAKDPDPARRPSMRRFAATLAELAAPEHLSRRARSPKVPEKQDAADTSRWRESTTRSAAATRRTPLVAIGLLLVATTALLLLVRSPQPSTSGIRTPAAGPPTTKAPVASPAAATAEVACVVLGGRSVEAPDPRCPHDVAIVGRRVTIDGQSYDVGARGDVLAVGSFGCRGEVTIAVLRPSTGDVFAFTDPGAEAQDVEPTANVPGAVALRAISVSERCQQLRVLDDAGQIVPVDLIGRA